MAIDKIFSKDGLDGIADNVFASVNTSIFDIKAMQQRKVAENVQVVIKALKKIEGDMRSEYGDIADKLAERITSIKDGKDGYNGADGRAGKDGKPGRDGFAGAKGNDGLLGRDGVDGIDGVSVSNAYIDFDGSLIIELSSGQVLNVGEVVSQDLAEKIQIITSGGGANLTGAVTSTGNATLLGSFTSAQLAGALTDETGTGAAVFATSPTLVTPALGTPTALVGTNITGTAAAFNLNGTVGATTPATGAFTTISSTGAATLQGLTVGLGGGANGLNTALGGSALASNTTGGQNTATGEYSLYSNTSGYYNTATGRMALYSNTTGIQNTAVGKGALTANTNGNINTAMGEGSLASTTTGSANTATGQNALSGNTTGSNNIAIGQGTGGGITTGSGNTILGASVTGLSSGLTNNIILANGTGAIKAQHDGTNWSLTGALAVTDNVTLENNKELRAKSSTNVASSILYLDTANNLNINRNTLGGVVQSFGTYQFYNQAISSVNMIVLDTGNVGIGTSSPLYKLQVKTGTNQNLQVRSNVYGGTSGVLLQTSNDADSASVGMEFGASQFLFGNGANALFTGNVGIGTTSPSYKIQVSTDSAAKPGVGGLWTVISDVRIKTNIVPADLDRCYEIVKSVPLKHFGFATGVYTDDQISDKNNLGWIAQDVQKVFKNAVSVKPFTLKTEIPDGIEEYQEQDSTLEAVEKTETSIQVINGKPVQVSQVVTSENKVMLFDTVDVLDEAGNAVLEDYEVSPAIAFMEATANAESIEAVSAIMGTRPVTYQMPRMITKTRPKVRHEVIEDCLDLNGGQMNAAMYGAVQSLMEKVEALEATVKTQAQQIKTLEGQA